MLTVSLEPAIELAIEVVKGLNQSYKHAEKEPTVEKFVDDFWQLFKSFIPVDDYIKVSNADGNPISKDSAKLLDELKSDIKDVIVYRSLASQSTMSNASTGDSIKDVFARVSINPLHHDANAEKSNINSLLFPIFDNLFKSVISELADDETVMFSVNLGLTQNLDTDIFFTRFTTPSEFTFWKNVSLVQMDVLTQNHPNINVEIETLTSDNEYSNTNIDLLKSLIPAKQEFAGIILGQSLDSDNYNIFNYDDCSLDLKKILQAI